MARFYFDEDISFQVVGLLRAVGHDVETVDDSKLREAKDHEQLLHAFQTERLLVTHNSKDFVLLHLAWIRWSAVWNVDPLPMHPGILVIPQTPVLVHRDAAYVLGELVDSGRELRSTVLSWRRQSGWTTSNSPISSDTTSSDP